MLSTPKTCEIIKNLFEIWEICPENGQVDLIQLVLILRHFKKNVNLP